jgi:hypothetical protein
MKNAVALVIVLFSLNFSHAQFIVTGFVRDSATGEPLSPASVYGQNTTIGTITDREGRFSLDLKSGGYDLVISFTGYQTQTVRVRESRQIDVWMIKEDRSLSEVVVRTSNEVPNGWEKYGDFFVEHFIGATPNATKTRLENPESLKFYFSKRSNKLKVLATEPLRISNHALGYHLTYQLDSFIYNYKTDINSYRGNSFFTEMEGTDSMRLAWERARANAYEGSLLHFMRSYYDSTLEEEGWIVDMLDEKNEKKFNKVNPYDTLYYSPLDSTMQIEIWYPRKLSITYRNKYPEIEYLKKMKLPKDIPYPISYIELNDAIAIMENGYFYEQKDWLNQGYWSWKNLADLLPYNYIPPGWETED